MLFSLLFLQPYFCGMDLECTRHNSLWALDRAIENVEQHFPVVGVLEQRDETLRVMQAMVPRYFGGIWEMFGKDIEGQLGLAESRITKLMSTF
jgi:dermatan/chondrotin sulfate uronyl 2-O-sulfotransferase UST